MAAGIELLNLGNRIQFDETQITQGRLPHEGRGAYYEMLESEGRVAVWLGQAAAREAMQAQLTADPTQEFNLRAATLILNKGSGHLIPSDPNEVDLEIVQLGRIGESANMREATKTIFERYTILSKRLLRELQASRPGAPALREYFDDLAARSEYLAVAIATLALPAETEPVTFDVIYALQASDPQRQDAFLVAAATIARDVMGPHIN